MRHKVVKRFSRTLTILVNLIVAVAVSGCNSLQFAYEHADWAVKRWVDRYLDLNRDQEGMFARHFAVIQDWHRHDALPDYVRFLSEVRSRVERGLAAEDVSWFVDGLKAHYRGLTNHSAGGLASLLSTLNDDQVHHLGTKLAESNREFVEEHGLSETESDRRKRGRERLLTRIESWTGPLSERQEQLLQPFFQAMPVIDQPSLANRQQRQQAFLQLLNERRNGAGFQEALQHWMTESDTQWSPAYRQWVRRSQDAATALTLALDHLLTSEQRRSIVRRLSATIDDLRAIEG